MTIDVDSQKMTVTISFSYDAEVFAGEDDMYEVADAELPDLEDIVQKTLYSNFDNVQGLDVKITPKFL